MVGHCLCFSPPSSSSRLCACRAPRKAHPFQLLLAQYRHVMGNVGLNHNTSPLPLTHPLTNSSFHCSYAYFSWENLYVRRMLCSRRIMSFFVGKDVRKLLKRKDSDAADRAKVVEELRASLFSDLQTSEGAKRLQQRLCGPTVSLTFNFFVSIGIILMNKLVLGKVGFNYPIFLTLIHYAVSWFLMSILNVFSLLPLPPPKSTSYYSLFTLGLVMSLSTGLANVSLKYNSVGFYQMAKIAVTPTIALAEFVLFRKTVSYQKVLALTVVSVGVAVSTVTDLEFQLFGACIALAWIIPSVMNKILWSNLQQQENWTALALMWKTTPITIFILLAMMPGLDPPGALSFNWNFHSTSVIFLSAALGFLLQWSGALALGATSATSHVVLGQFKTCVILLGGFILFNSVPGMTSICGAVTALSGMSLYTYLNLQDTHKQVAKTITQQSSSPMTKSRLTKERCESCNGECTAEPV